MNFILDIRLKSDTVYRIFVLLLELFKANNTMAIKLAQKWGGILYVGFICGIFTTNLPVDTQNQHDLAFRRFLIWTTIENAQRNKRKIGENAIKKVYFP